MFHRFSSFASRARAIALAAAFVALAALALPAVSRAAAPPAGTMIKTINVNTATAAELTALPGIGQAKADAIVKYREEHGSYRSPEDLLQVRGIGEALLTKIRPHITIGRAKSNP